MCVRKHCESKNVELWKQSNRIGRSGGGQSRLAKLSVSVSVMATAVVSLSVSLGSTRGRASGAISNTKQNNYAMCECENAREITTYIGHAYADITYNIYIYIYI